MVEKFMKITEESPVYTKLEEVVKAKKVWREVVNQFCEDFGIESNKIGYSAFTLAIEPTEKDLKNEAIKFNKDKFTVRKSSYLHKEYVKRCQEAGLDKMNMRLFCWDYNISVYGKHSIRTFKYEDIWYIKVIANDDFQVDPKYETIISPKEYYTYEELFDKQ